MEISEQTIRENEKKHLVDLEKVGQAHTKEIRALKIGKWITVGVAVCAGGLFGYILSKGF